MKYYSEKTIIKMFCDFAKTGSLPNRNGYPSIEVPEPHGRIIDEKQITSVETHKRGDVYSIEVEAPTILEASK